MEGEVALCWVCHSSRKQLICPLCACNAINTDKSSLRELGVAILRRTKLKEELETVVEQKVLTLSRPRILPTKLMHPNHSVAKPLPIQIGVDSRQNEAEALPFPASKQISHELAFALFWMPTTNALG